MEKIMYYRIPYILKERKLTQKWLGEQIGLSKQSMSNYLSRRREFRLKKLEEIALVLDIPFGELFFDSRFDK